MNKMRKKISSKVKDLKKTKSTPKKSSKNNLSLYANLAHKRKTKKDAEARRRAEYLASLPKNPVKRFFYKLHPKRVAKYRSEERRVGKEC